MPAGGRSRSPPTEAWWWLLPPVSTQKESQSTGQPVVFKHRWHRAAGRGDGGEGRGAECCSTELAHPWGQESKRKALLE